jgi:hypothetical protein
MQYNNIIVIMKIIIIIMHNDYCLLMLKAMMQFRFVQHFIPFTIVFLK